MNRHQRRATKAIGGGGYVDSTCNLCGQVFYRVSARAHRRPNARELSDRAFRRHLAVVCPKVPTVAPSTPEPAT